MPALKDVKAKVEQINDPASGRMLPGTEIEPYYDRTDLLHVTTETVTENLCLGVALVVAILFMFVNNIKTAIIVAINIPLALLFAFTMLYLRGKSANLLSIGAVDFGIIVDSSVVVVENIYRNLASHNYPDLPHQGADPALRARDRPCAVVFRADHGVRLRAAVCHDRPGGPALRADGADVRVLPGGRLVLALTLSPVLCMLLFKNFKPVQENLLVRALKFRYLRNLQLCLRFPRPPVP